MAEIRRNVKNIHQSGLLLLGVDPSKAKHDVRTIGCHVVKNEEVLEWVTYLLIDVLLVFLNPEESPRRLTK
ncbi:MAG: hypothetical protein LWW98_08805 [Deltaproteobacteria bacterium]|nr:hypothetical protein [Deltaproteobacteria bacterium]